MGMGIVIEYENRRGDPQWIKPTRTKSDYAAFGLKQPAARPDETIGLKFEKIPGGRGGYNRWTINGRSWPEANPLFMVQRGKRYRLVMDNHSGDEHPVHLHRHTFEVTKVGDQVLLGLMKDTISMPRFSKPRSTSLPTIPAQCFSIAIIRITWTKALRASSPTPDRFRACVLTIRPRVVAKAPTNAAATRQPACSRPMTNVAGAVR
jgi:hypothetical protein